MTVEMARAWAIDLDVHITRQAGYKGSQVRLSDQAVQLSCDAVTNLGALFLAPRVQDDMLLLLVLYMDSVILSAAKVVCVLQVKGCKNDLKKGATTGLDVLIANACPSELTLKILPNIPA